MTTKPPYKFRKLKNFSLSDIKEVSGKIVEAVLNIDSCDVEHKLILKHPKVPPPSMPPTTVRDLFNNLTTQSVGSFEVFPEQDNSNVQWRIEILDNSGKIVNNINCKEIEGLPKEGWK